MPSSATFSHASAKRTLRIEGPLTVATVASWHQRLVAEPSPSLLHVDAAGVTDCDTLGIQLVIALERAASQGGLRTVTTSPALETVRTAAGVTPIRKGDAA